MMPSFCAAIFLAASCSAAPLVAIDVGHSRLLPGAISARGRPEFEFNQDLAKALQKKLAAERVPNTLILGVGRELLQRTAAAREQGATFFLSIHHDSVQQKYLASWNWAKEKQHYADRFSGFSLFISRKNARFAESLECARRIGAALERAGFFPSAHHAENIPGENREWADRKRGVYYFDDLVVLKSAEIPAVLIEAGIIVNRQEEMKMREAAVQKAIARSIARGLRACGAT